MMRGWNELGRGARATALLAATVAVAACSAADFMVGSKPAKVPPTQAAATYQITACRNLADQSAVPLPAPLSYYLAQGPQGLALWEFDQAGNGSVITNAWSDGQQDHFFTYIKTSVGFEIVLPTDRSQPGTRLVYSHGGFDVDTQGSVMHVRGTPAVSCVMVPQQGAAPAATAPSAPATPGPEAGPVAGQCHSGRDCPGTQACENGTCVAASARNAKAKGTSAGSCATDQDCKGDRICEAGECRDPNQAPKAKPVPTESGCATDQDCKGERICEKGRCVVPGRR
jgi:hypothetical protein